MKVITRQTLESLQAGQPINDPNNEFVEGAKFFLQAILDTEGLWQEAELKEEEK